ncbi:MAG: uroporphyrinogen decarboxylase family protein [Planctomycetota bacterium]
MTPRERICAAMRREEVDMLPCSIYFNSNLKANGFDCSARDGSLGLAMSLGVDPFVGSGLGFSTDPEVQISNWVEHPSGAEYPVLWQAWDTPAGRLTQAVQLDEVCRNWKTIQWCDESASSIAEPLIKEHADIERCRYLLQPLTEKDYAHWIAARQQTFETAEAHDLPFVLNYGRGLSTLMFIMGAERSVLFAMDDPDGFEELAEMIHRCEMRNIELAGRGHVDILKRFGGYEMCNFYNPDIFKKVCVPRLKAEVECAHANGLLIFYRVVTGMEPVLDMIADIGFDCIEGGEPCLSRCSLETWHDAFAGKAASWTGISTPVLLGGDDPEAVRREVRHCVDVFGRTGFILGVTNSIRGHFPWENTLAMVDEWKKLRQAPA